MIVVGYFRGVLLCRIEVISDQRPDRNVPLLQHRLTRPRPKRIELNVTSNQLVVGHPFSLDPTPLFHARQIRMANYPRFGSGAQTAKRALFGEVVAHVKAGESPSLSAFITGAVVEKVARSDNTDRYREWLHQLDEQFGSPSAEAYAWAREVLGW